MCSEPWLCAVNNGCACCYEFFEWLPCAMNRTGLDACSELMASMSSELMASVCEQLYSCLWTDSLNGFCERLLSMPGTTWISHVLTERERIKSFTYMISIYPSSTHTWEKALPDDETTNPSTPYPTEDRFFPYPCTKDTERYGTHVTIWTGWEWWSVTYVYSQFEDHTP